jgi:hypothetical protein
MIAVDRGSSSLRAFREFLVLVHDTQKRLRARLKYECSKCVQCARISQNKPGETFVN